MAYPMDVNAAPALATAQRNDEAILREEKV
jgi:hypothetical protein